MIDEELYRRVEERVYGALPEEWIEGFEMGVSWLLDLKAAIQDVIPYDIRHGGIITLYEAGERSGERLGRGLMNYFQLEEKDIKERAYYFDAFFARTQIVHIKFIKSGEERILRFVGGTPFAKMYRYAIERNVCYHTAGIIAGITKELAKKEVFVREIRCLAAGDEDCDFLVEKI